jgi:hypothetical protein
MLRDLLDVVVGMLLLGSGGIFFIGYLRKQRSKVKAKEKTLQAKEQELGSEEDTIKSLQDKYVAGEMDFPTYEQKVKDVVHRPSSSA